MEENLVNSENDNDAKYRAALEAFRETFGVGKVDVRGYSPLALAYIGDAIFDVIYRTIVVSRVNMAANKYHHEVSHYVCAGAQSNLIEKLKPYLTPEEERIYLRGRNSKPYNKAKNATVIDYQRATGLECLVGYLYLDGQIDRLLTLIKLGMN